MVAFNTSTGIPNTFVQLADGAARRASPASDVKSNLAEAGTISMEFTTIGRLLGELQMQQRRQVGCRLPCHDHCHTGVGLCETTGVW